MWCPPLQVSLWTSRPIDLEEVQEVIDVNRAIPVQITWTRWGVLTTSIIGVGQGIVVLSTWIRATFERKDTTRIEVGIRVKVQGRFVGATGIET